MILFMISYCGQDRVVVLAPFPTIRTLFNCTLCPTGAKGFISSHKEASLVYFSTFDLGAH